VDSCHPERSLAQSEAKRQTQSKDPVPAHSGADNNGNFRIVIHFLDEHDTETFSVSSHEATACDSPAGKYRVKTSP
jgi:hypothetical protein